ncbi:MAG: pullulanase-type alpha-1,6-glucosidase [Woeseiaceae bacterium]|nr:pullulanase-type alpha-1,6-glucosidase [Woeseiaceae bacterium]
MKSLRATALRILAPAVFLIPASVIADHTSEPAGVALVGSLQDELSCPGDWQPECASTELTTADGIVWSATFVVPAGNYEYKVALNDAWDENYGAGGASGGANLPLSVATATSITFSYDHRSHVISDNLVPASVTVTGSLQSELGCGGDWDPGCSATFLDLDTSDGVWQRVFNVPAGDWEYKAVINGDWFENYGANAARNGGNIPLSLGGATDVKFFYDDATNWITSNQNAVIASVPGSFQSELGCPGDWQPDCLRSWLQDPDGDGLYAFATRAIPPGDYEAKVAHDESWSENYGAGGVQNGPNIPFSVSAAGEQVVFSYDTGSNILEITGDGPRGNITEARAYWLAEDVLAWNVPDSSNVRLHYSADASLALSVDGVVGGDSIALTRSGVVDGAIAEKFRHLAGLPVFRIAATDVPNVPQILKSQFVLAATDSDGMPVDATGIQPPGVLDDLYTYGGNLGATFDGEAPTIRVWAPTARSVRLHLFADANEANPAIDIVPMTEDPATGTWSVAGDASWNRMYYLYEVEVYARFTGQVETFLVTDPYSLNLSQDSRRTQIVNLDDHDLKPRGWDKLRKRRRVKAPEDIAIYELHVRDFSMQDESVPELMRGTFKAFALPFTRGMRHLRGLSRAGLSHVHLLPAFDCATIAEDRSVHATPGDLSGFAPNGTEQQAAIEPIRDEDGFNWCYDPYHYTAPEGSYATDADGTNRIYEFRQMVAGLNRVGLRVVMDVVYNHTSGSLQGDKSVLDKIVPDYYHRLNDAGYIETSTCCANTATEHNMMEKLMLDSLRTWATAYKVDGFRFDLMGHHTKANIENARDMLQSLTRKRDGVDGRAIYLYGEGWNFGEVANNARFEQGTQANMGDRTGVGSFNDRMRDAVRGGGPFDTGQDHIRRQGFINGLYVDPNALNSGADQEREELLRLTDWIRLGLAGTLSEFQFQDRNGNLVMGRDIDYFGNPGAGYASDPQEVINYAAAHDNETLFDISQYKLPVGTSTDDRVRVANLANSIIALSQGIPFFHAGQDMLRSKSMDRNSYNSGDWFNVLDFSYNDNGWGRGMPPSADNQNSWGEISPLLGNPELDDIDRKDIRRARKHLREMLRIRKSSKLFRLRTGADVMERVEFHNTGPSQDPGLVVMSLRGHNGIEIVVLFNASPEEKTFYLDTGEDSEFQLHHVQADSYDPVVRTACYDDDDHSFYVPARTAAVFVADD